MPTVKVGDISLYYEIHGEGEPLVMIMGHGGSTVGWFCQIPELSREYRVIAFDNRGAGQSDKPDVPYTVQMLANDLTGLLDTLAVDAAHIYGISMGGMIAQEFALLYPQRVISLVLGCSGPGGRHAVLPDQDAMAMFHLERVKRLAPEERMRESLPFLYSQAFIDANPDIVEYVIAEGVKHAPPLHGFLRQLEAAVSHDTYDRLPQINVPTLVICGSGDRISPIQNSRLLASHIPNAELVILEDAGHVFFIEAADQANKVILDFLRRHAQSRSTYV
jgi:3-oxoadipate enol-lactonase